VNSDINNKAYLRQLPLAMLFILLYCVITFIAEPYQYIENKPNYPVLIAQEALRLVCICLALGIIFKRWKAAGWVLLTFVALAALGWVTPLLLLEKDKTPGIPFRVFMDILRPLLYTGALVLFLGLINRSSPKKLLVVTLVLFFLYKGIAAIGYASAGLSEYFDWHTYRAGSATSSSRAYTNNVYINLLASLVSHFALLVGVAELNNYLQHKMLRGKTRLLNLQNDGGTGSLLVFWGFKTAVWLMAIGTISYLSENRWFWRMADKSQQQYFQFSLVLTIFCTFLLAAVIGWYLRKLVLEFMLSYGVESKFVYWLLLIPGIGFIAWLVIMAANQKQHSWRERYDTLANLEASSSLPVTLLILLGHGAMLLRVMPYATAGLILIVICAIALFIWYIYAWSGYLFNLWLLVALLLITAGVFLYRGWDDNMGRSELLSYGVIFGVLVFNFFQVIVLSPVYHLSRFEYIPAEDPLSENSTTDLFSDHPNRSAT